MTNGILSDYDIAQIIEIVREMSRKNREWLDAYGDMYLSESPPNPTNYLHLIRLKRIVKEAMKYRRAHRKAVTKIWTAYANYVIEEMEKKL